MDITDTELLLKYRKYKRKRNTMMMLIVFLIIGLVTSGIIMSLKKVNKVDSKPKIEEKIAPPELLLKESEISVTQGADIDYKSYVLSAKDSFGKDLTESVSFTIIDINSVKKQEVVYEVADSHNNITKVVLVINVIEKEKPKEDKPSTDTKTQPKKDNQTNNSSSNNSNNNTSGSKDTSKESKYFLFSDGYTMGNVDEECAKVLRESGRAGICVPLKNAQGIYIGMRLDYY